LEVYTSGYDVVERNKVLLPLYFSDRSWKIGVFGHSAGHYGYTKGSINSDFHRLPVRVPDSAEYARNVDYVITRGLSSKSDEDAGILEYYSLIKNDGNLKIFKRTRRE